MPTPAIFPSLTMTSARKPGLPVPSTTIPLRMTRSSMFQSFQYLPPGMPGEFFDLAGAAGADQRETDIGIQRHRSDRAVLVLKTHEKLGRAIMAGRNFRADDDGVR